MQAHCVSIACVNLYFSSANAVKRHGRKLIMRFQPSFWIKYLIVETNAIGLGRGQGTSERMKPPCTDDDTPGFDGTCTKIAPSSHIEDIWGLSKTPTRYHIFGPFMTTEASQLMTSATTTASLATAETGLVVVSSTMDSGAARNLRIF